MGKKLYVIAGEASGDLHGGNLVRALKDRAGGEELAVRAWGGDHMQAAGAEVVKHYRDLAFMGFTQVLMNLPAILGNIKACKADILAFKPDAIILIDYPGFNLRIAEFAHAQGIKVFYYISPQVWAWKEGRVKLIKRVVDSMFVILPFEKDWYAERGVEVEFVGHPLLDAIAQENPDLDDPGITADPRPLVALLPGSRMQEIKRMLPVMLSVVRHFPDHRFVVAGAPSVPEEAYRSCFGSTPVELITGRTYGLLRKAKAALVTSGTATLETALIGTPEAVCYGGGAVNVWLAKRFIKVPFISLVNLIMGREVVRELIQGALKPSELRAELDRLLNDTAYRERMKADLRDLREKLGGPGASEHVADRVWKSLYGKV
ncbi:MAG: lipid-A-disaccharide synthase [Flavobacteriales bacterium]|jgi:lipid-A-disaccharide synthase|nr:lipid-A-disaccharide synthase [Flavobacteriales bacterium]MCB0757661.1 lipid-A-disaccharide synthase [Flavobacteriales bacterium]